MGPPDEDRLHELGLAGELGVLEPRDQLVVERPGLEPGEVRAEAVVGAEPERDVPIRVARDVEDVRVLEHGLVAVRRRERHQHRLALGNGHAAEDLIAGGGAHELLHRRHVPEHLLHRARHEVEVVHQESQLLGMREQRRESAADRGAGGVVAGGRDDHVVADRLQDTDRLTVDLGVRDAPTRGRRAGSPDGRR